MNEPKKVNEMIHSFIYERNNNQPNQPNQTTEESNQMQGQEKRKSIK